MIAEEPFVQRSIRRSDKHRQKSRQKVPVRFQKQVHEEKLRLVVYPDIYVYLTYRRLVI